MFSFLYDAIVFVLFSLFFFKQKTAYEMRISDWSSDVCSCDLNGDVVQFADFEQRFLKDQRGGALHDLADSRSLLLTGEGAASDRKSVVQGKSVSERVDIGGRRSIKKNNHNRKYEHRQRTKKLL